MREYIELGHMTSNLEAIENRKEQYQLFLPHHAVIIQESLTTKVRVVFDTSTSVSLNDTLMVGPTINSGRFKSHSI